MHPLETYKQVFQNIFGVDESSLNGDFTFKNVDAWDSMTHLTLISDLEAAFDVLFESEDILHFGGFLNGIEILKKYGVDFDS